MGDDPGALGVHWRGGNCEWVFRKFNQQNVVAGGRGGKPLRRAGSCARRNEGQSLREGDRQGIDRGRRGPGGVKRIIETQNDRD